MVAMEKPVVFRIAKTAVEIKRKWGGKTNQVTSQNYNHHKASHLARRSPIAL